MSSASAPASPFLSRLSLATGPSRFLAVGLVGLTVDTVAFQLALAAGLEPAWARLCSLAVATMVTWTLNRRFTFARTGRRRRVELARYAVVTTGAQGFSYGVFLTLITVAPALDPQLSMWIGAGLAAVGSYLGQRLFTFAAVPAGAAP